MLVADITEIPTSDRERAVMHLLVAGPTNKEIADELHVEVTTVRGHLRILFAKFGVSNRTQLALVAQQYLATTRKGTK